MEPVIVQEPLDTPRWVFSLEDGYQKFVDAVLGFNRTIAAITGAQEVSLYGVIDKIKMDDLHKTANQFAIAVFDQYNKDLSVSGVESTIPSSDLPDSILPPLNTFAKEPHCFSPLKLYQYLHGKYSNISGKMVFRKMADTFTNLFGHGQWKYDHSGGENRYNPRLDNFIADGFDLVKGQWVGHISVAIEKTPIMALSGHLCYDFRDRGAIIAQLLIFTNMLRHLGHTIDQGKMNNFFSLIDRSNGSGPMYGTTGSIVDGVSGKTIITFTMRKDRIVTAFDNDLFQTIKTFINDNYFKKGE